MAFFATKAYGINNNNTFTLCHRNVKEHCCYVTHITFKELEETMMLRHGLRTVAGNRNTDLAFGLTCPRRE